MLGVILISGPLVFCDVSSSLWGAYLPGDIVIGILSSVHSNFTQFNASNRPHIQCDSFNLISFVQSLAIIHTIETINNSSLLPGVRLGYLMCDPCAFASKALHCVEHMLAVNGSLPVLSDYSNFSSPVKAFLGERYSELSIPVAKMLSLYMIPQISCTSSAPILSDKLRYPSFFRVIPSDIYQTQALAKLMRHFSWNWVGVVTLDDDYGNAALENFLLAADKVKVCVEYKEVLPTIQGIEQNMKNVVNRIQSSSARVVLLILRAEVVEILFKEVINRNISRIWIASDAWSMAGSLMKMNDINKVGDILGFTFVTGEIPGFKDYLQNLKPSPGAWNDFISEYKQMIFNCIPGQNSENTTPSCNLNSQESNNDYLINSVDLTATFSQRVAVYAIAHAIKKVLKCNNTDCPEDTNFPLEKLVAILWKINFTLDNQTYSFNKDGDFDTGYDLIMWKNVSDRRVPSVVGKFLISKKDVDVYENNIPWTNNTVPLSRCSETCPPGTEKSVSDILCCYNCTFCNEGYFSNMTDQEKCEKCPNGYTSNPGSSACQQWNIWFLKWSDSYSIVVMIGTGIGILLLIFSFIFFILHRSNPTIKYTLIYSCIMKFGIFVTFGGVIMFLGKPCTEHCVTQQAMYSLGFTLCVSCILTKAFHTFLASVAYDPHTRHKLQKIDKPFAIIGFLTAVQGFICIFWFVFDRPGVQELKSNSLNLTMNLLCTQGSSMISFWVMHAYIALLALVCFLLAFKGKDGETEPIVFSMLIHLFAWFCFIPVFITQHELRPIIQISAIMVSNYGVIFCHFTPKWFIIMSEKLEHKNKNSLRVIRRRSTNTVSHSEVGFGSFRDSSRTLSDSEDVGISGRDNGLNIGSEDSIIITSTSSSEQITVAEDKMPDPDNVLNPDDSEDSIIISIKRSTLSNIQDNHIPCLVNGVNRDYSEESTSSSIINSEQFPTRDFEIPFWHQRQYIFSIRRRRTKSF
ncbi:G-protein coupled receptor family C group 6 member A-like precursor [Silurus meridionalis]|nr:G-protein coupled receptor family C group 6 member A-like precursor [Silurus meridionalis]